MGEVERGEGMMFFSWENNIWVGKEDVPRGPRLGSLVMAVVLKWEVDD